MIKKIRGQAYMRNLSKKKAASVKKPLLRLKFIITAI